MKPIALFFLLFLVCQTRTNAQQLESILLAAGEAEAITQSYLNPALKGIVFSMNDGWYTTAKTHKLGGFDISIGANLALVPNAEKDFLFKPSDYNFVTNQNGGEQSVPTILGDDSNAQLFDVKIPQGDGTFKVAIFEMPGGIAGDFPLKGVPSPFVQLGIGIPLKTDLKIRYIPNLGFDEDVNNQLIGVGLQHSISQYIPTMETSPIDLSALVAYGNTKVTYAITDEEALDDVAVRNGEASFKLNTLSIQAIASVDLVVIEFFASVGYGSGKSKLALNGDYTLTYQLEDSNGNNLGEIDETISNPLNFNSKVQSTRLGFGSRLNLGPLKIFASYALQEYSNITAGIALSVR